MYYTMYFSSQNPRFSRCYVWGMKTKGLPYTIDVRIWKLKCIPNLTRSYSIHVDNCKISFFFFLFEGIIVHRRCSVQKSFLDAYIPWTSSNLSGLNSSKRKRGRKILITLSSKHSLADEKNWTHSRLSKEGKTQDDQLLRYYKERKENLRM